MTTPVTTLDERFSDPQATPTGWDDTRRVLETAQLFWVSTVRADGRPHVTPVVAVWFEAALHFCTGEAEQKAVNLRSNPHVVLTTGCNDWDSGVDVVVEGDAIRVTDDTMLNRLSEAWARRWDGRWQYLVRDGCFFHHDEDEVLSEGVHVFAVRPTQILAFAKGTFSHTRHRF
jgi:nitroimidazol reductase NimA-like FMN-containing flavoprotein (pyridoxamine 5'-phosphate oxidase superfamily)